jgi:uncharacterized membrane protein YedE/YeeE
MSTRTVPTAAASLAFEPADRGSLNRLTAAIATLAILAGTVYLANVAGWRQSALFLVGAGAGLVLYHAAFGFTSAWRVFIADGRGAGLRAQMLMLALTCIVFFPLLASGQVFGHALRGFVSPAGVGVLVGAFIFGLGMQLGGGCASGTLYSVGGGNTRMVVTLAAFIAGSVIGTVHAQWWAARPSLPPISLVTALGPVLALAVSLGLFAAIWTLTIVVERRRHGRLLNDERPGVAGHRWLRGPWPLAAGAIGLAAVNVATLLIAGRPWGVTSAFGLWGAKTLATVGVEVQTWSYWAAPGPSSALRQSVALDVTSVMNVGIMLGALTAAALAGRFAPGWRISARSLAAAVIGGLLLGYGARIAYGCNIGAYFSGIGSGSLHGWLWLPAAFMGSVVGTSLRPLFDLRVERSKGC